MQNPYGRDGILARRKFMAVCSSLGLGGAFLSSGLASPTAGRAGIGPTLFPGVLWAKVQAAAQDSKGGEVKITAEMIDSAAAIAGVAIAPEYRQMMLDGLNEHARGYQEIYKLHMPNSAAPAFNFDPVLATTKF